MSGECRVCGVEAKQVCGRCRGASYCGREHQIADWKGKHKAECRPVYRLERSKDLGRYLVAGRDICAGEVIMKESPMVIGPKMNCEPLCLGCHRELEEPPEGREDFFKCKGCGWPLCSEACQSHPAHKKECELMSSRGFRCGIGYKGEKKREPAYCVITPLRCLLMEKKRLDSFLELESHAEIRGGSQLYKVLRANLVPFVVEAMKLPFDADTIMRVAAVLDTNCFLVKIPSVKIRGLYKECAMICHDCTPNTKHHFTDTFEIVMVATQDIPEGTIITASYSQSIWPTEVRREQLLASKCFHCTCRRCADPTELGTYLGAHRCSKCCKDYLLSRDPLEPVSSWHCASCGHTVTARDVCKLHMELQAEMKNLDKTTPGPMENFLRRHLNKTPFVHKNIYQIVQVKYALCQLYGQQLQELTAERLERRCSYIYDIMEVVNVLQPGLSRIRGELYCDLQETKLVLLRIRYNLGKIKLEDAKEEIKSILNILDKANAILKTEPDLLPKMAQHFENVKKISEVYCQ